MTLARHEEIIGRYAYIDFNGVENRVYYEEAGEGIPIILGHTAGADGREYRRILNDKDITKNFRCIAYDMPYHGKSLPPYGWWEKQYNIDTQGMVDFPTLFAEQLGIENPVWLGMSMGGHQAIDLAIHYPDKWRATIGLEGALRTNEQYRACGMDMVRFEHDNPMITRNALGAAMQLNMCPTAPYENIKEISWIYSQGGPGVFAGDLWYYNETHNVTPEQARSIDTKKCMVYLLTGEYDPNTEPADTQVVADLIDGCYFKAMEGLGHFPCCEDYDAFKPYLMPILEDILAKSK